MKSKIFIFLICFLCSKMFIAQNITNTLGSNGIFSIKDGSTVFLTLHQTSGLVDITKNLSLTEAPGLQTGILYKGADRFLHTYHPSGNEGYNTFLGINSGNFTLSGTGNQGSYNTAIGNSSMISLTVGSQNTGVGALTLYFNTTGYFNTALGVSSLLSNTTGYDNTSVGVSSLEYNTTGYDNSAFGYASLSSNTTGESNTGIGMGSLLLNTIGYQNSALGTFSLFSNVSGYSNTAVGMNSLYHNTFGTYNSAFGTSSLFSNTTGTFNSAFGHVSLYFSTGSYNTALGYSSGTGITTGSNNTAVGSNAQVPTGTASNQVRIGNTLVTYAGVQVAWTITSDKRWKKNILPSNLGLGFISKLNPVSYTRINDENPKTEYGLIAQEVEEVLKEEGIENTGMLTVTDEGMYELRYNDLLAPMVKAIQELKIENDELKMELESLKTVEKRLAKLEQMILETNSLKEAKLTENKP